MFGSSFAAVGLYSSNQGIRTLLAGANEFDNSTFELESNTLGSCGLHFYLIQSLFHALLSISTLFSFSYLLSFSQIQFYRNTK